MASCFFSLRADAASSFHDYLPAVISLSQASDFGHLAHFIHCASESVLRVLSGLESACARAANNQLKRGAYFFLLYPTLYIIQATTVTIRRPTCSTSGRQSAPRRKSFSYRCDSLPLLPTQLDSQ